MLPVLDSLFHVTTTHLYSFRCPRMVFQLQIITLLPTFYHLLQAAITQYRDNIMHRYLYDTVSRMLLRSPSTSFVR